VHHFHAFGSVAGLFTNHKLIARIEQPLEALTLA